MDSLSRICARFIDFLFMDNPQGTAMGALGGVVVIFLTRLFRPLLEQQNVIDVDGVNPLLFVAAGVFVANLGRAMRGFSLPAVLEARIQLIREEYRSRRIPREEAQRLYKELLEEAISTVAAKAGPGGPASA